jgi:ketosteroid isomerase-like protein
VAGDDLSTVSALFEAVNAGDRKNVIALTDPEVLWSPTVWSGAHSLRGHEGVTRWLDQFGPGIEDLRIDVSELEVVADRILALGKVHDSRGETPFSIEVAWIIVIRNDLIAEARAYDTWEEGRAAAEAELLG